MFGPHVHYVSISHCIFPFSLYIVCVCLLEYQHDCLFVPLGGYL